MLRFQAKSHDFYLGHSGTVSGFSPNILSVSFHQCSTLIFIYTLLLPEGRTGENWEGTFQKAMLIRKSGTTKREALAFFSCLESII